jgi:CheY-like chemotaxis protein
MRAICEMSDTAVSSNKQRILVVDDSRNIRRSFCRMLEFSGYDAVEASSGMDAIRCVERGGVALVLMDVVMPGMTGIEAARTISSKPIVPPVILMSGYLNAQRRAEIPRVARAVLGKPIDEETLLDAVGRELARGPANSNCEAAR